MEKEIWVTNENGLTKREEFHAWEIQKMIVRKRRNRNRKRGLAGDVKKQRVTEVCLEEVAGSVSESHDTKKQKKEVHVIEVEDEDEEVLSKEQTKATSTDVTKSCNIPYLKHLEMVLMAVLEEREDYKNLFVTEELQLFWRFRSLSFGARVLVTRMFGRKGPWFRCCDLRNKYFQHEEGFEECVEELCETGLICRLDEKMDKKETMCIAESVLTLNELKELNGKLKLPKVTNKDQALKALSKVANNSRTLFGQAIPIATMMKKVMRDHVIGLRDELRHLLQRSFSLFYLTSSDNSFQHRQTLDAGKQESTNETFFAPGLLAGFGKLTFEEYSCYRTKPIFSCRKQLEEFEVAVALLGKIEFWTANNSVTGNQGVVFPRFEELSPSLKELNFLSECSTIEFVQCLFSYLKEKVQPEKEFAESPFLYQFTVARVLCDAVIVGISFLERERKYTEAIFFLKELLGRYAKLNRRRGFYWNRMAINYKHLNLYDQALEACINCLQDPTICETNAHFVEALKRLHRLLKKGTDEQLLTTGYFLASTYAHVPKEADIPVEVVFGRDEKGRSERGRCQYITSLEDGASSVFCTVEEFAIDHYQEQEGWYGLHLEGSVFTSLFALFMWDCIFMPGIPNVFQNSFQSAPLDLYHSKSLFYVNRTEAIEKRLGEIMGQSRLALASEVERCWQVHEGKQVCGAPWGRVSLCEMKSIAACVGSQLLVSILKRLCVDFAHFGGGGPDLTLLKITKPDGTIVSRKNEEGCYPSLAFEEDWTYEIKFVEVKSVNDHLSHKQIAWLKFLHDQGTDAAVLKVTHKK